MHWQLTPWDLQLAGVATPLVAQVDLHKEEVGQEEEPCCDGEPQQLARLLHVGEDANKKREYIHSVPGGGGGGVKGELRHLAKQSHCLGCSSYSAEPMPWLNKRSAHALCWAQFFCRAWYQAIAAHTAKVTPYSAKGTSMAMPPTVPLTNMYLMMMVVVVVVDGWMDQLYHSYCNCT